jgi:hypothetical protein
MSMGIFANLLNLLHDAERCICAVSNPDIGLLRKEINVLGIPTLVS